MQQQCHADSRLITSRPPGRAINNRTLPDFNYILIIGSIALIFFFPPHLQVIALLIWLCFVRFSKNLHVSGVTDAINRFTECISLFFVTPLNIKNRANIPSRLTSGQVLNVSQRMPRAVMSPLRARNKQQGSGVQEATGCSLSEVRHLVASRPASAVEGPGCR